MCFDFTIWRNQAVTEMEASSLLTSFCITGRHYTDYEVESLLIVQLGYRLCVLHHHQARQDAPAGAIAA